MKLRAWAPLAGYTPFLLASILSLHATTAFAALPSFDANAYSSTAAFARIVVYAVLAGAFWRKTSEPLPPRATAATGICLGLVGFALMACSSELAGVPTPTIGATARLGAACIGCAQALLSLLWLSVLPLLTYRQSYLYVLGSHAAATGLCALVLLLPAGWYLPLTALAFAVSGACARFVPASHSTCSSLAAQAPDISPILGKGVLAVGLFALVSGFVSRMAEPGAADPTHQQYLVLGVSACVLVIMSVPALAYHQPLKLESSYRVALPLSALGFLVLPGLTDAVPPSLAGTLATTGYMMCGIILSCTIAEVSKTAHIPSVPLYTASEAVSLLCLLAGSATGALCEAYLPEADAGFTVIGMGCLYLLTVGASWLAGRDRVPKRREAPEGEAVKADGDAGTAHPRNPFPPAPASVVRSDEGPSRIDAAGTSGAGANALRGARANARPSYSPYPDGTDLHGAGKAAPLPHVSAHPDPEPGCPNPQRLNDQESAIFEQLLRGRTVARIAQDLYLSQSAVKYHTQKIYRAFDVHSRAELMALMRQPPTVGGMQGAADEEAPAMAAAAPSEPAAEALPQPSAAAPPTPSFRADAAKLDDLARLAAQHGLTERERQTCSLLAQGCSTIEVADALGVSENTAKTHMKRLYKKLGVHSKQDIIDLTRNGGE